MAHPIMHLFSPHVMKSAWDKVQWLWYQTGYWCCDRSEFLAWRAKPWEHLHALARDLAEERYRPGPFPVVPVSKKSGHLRHFVVPSVRDQVAFLVYLVLLGPLYEARMSNVSFGNRLFRPRVQTTAGDHKTWSRLPFSLHHKPIFDSLSRRFGLFTRVAQGLAGKSMAGPSSKEDERRDSIIEKLAAEDPTLVPYRDYLTGPSQPGRLCYARLDAELAFPMLDREPLKRSLVELLENEGGAHDWGRAAYPTLTRPRAGQSLHNCWPEPGNSRLEAHPWYLLAGDREARLELARRLGQLVGEVRYAPWCEPTEWGDSASLEYALLERAACPDSHHGGGADAAELYDPRGAWPMALARGRGPEEMGRLVQRLRSQTFGLPTGLVISGLLLNVALTETDRRMCRFCSEHKDQAFYLRFVDDTMLFARSAELLKEAIELLEGQLAAVGLRLNATKVRPESVRRYLTARRSREIGAREGLDIPPDQRLGHGDAGGFMATVGKNVSLGQLMGQHRNDPPGSPKETGEDPPAIADADLLPAVNKLARVRWATAKQPDGEVEAEPGKYIRQIMSLAERALRKNPDESALWRPIFVIALRASLIIGSGACTEWFRDSMLPLIRWQAEDGSNEGHHLQSWEILDHPRPDAISDETWRRAQYNARLRTSYQRMMLWRYWAECVRALDSIARDEGSPAAPSPLASHLTPTQARHLWTWFSDFRPIARTLYEGEATDQSPPFLWWWEAEALQDALLAAHEPNPALCRLLGPPRPHLLRWCDEERAELLLGRASASLERLKRALCSVLPYDGMPCADPYPDALSVAAAAWSARCRRSEETMKERPSSSPPDLFIFDQDHLGRPVTPPTDAWGPAGQGLGAAQGEPGAEAQSQAAAAGDAAGSAFETGGGSL